jgi:hypothetical protein
LDLWERPIFLGKVGAGCRRLLGKVGANRRHSWGEYFLYVPVLEPVAGGGFLWIFEYPTKTPPRLRLEKKNRLDRCLEVQQINKAPQFQEMFLRFFVELGSISGLSCAIRVIVAIAGTVRNPGQGDRRSGKKAIRIPG